MDRRNNMYQNQANAPQRNPNMSTAGLGVVGGIEYDGALQAQKAPMSPLQSALNEQGEQLDKLTACLTELTNRLEPIRRVEPQDTQNDPGDMAMPHSSSLTSQVIVQTSTVKMLQRAVNDLISQLEV
jgi:uncharacterized coiled-coil protein SlyX